MSRSDCGCRTECSRERSAVEECVVCADRRDAVERAWYLAFAARTAWYAAQPRVSLRVPPDARKAAWKAWRGTTEARGLYAAYVRGLAALSRAKRAHACRLDVTDG